MAEDHPTDDVDAAVAEARARFEMEFADSCERISTLLDLFARTRDRDAITSAARILHRMGGLGGTIGFPQVSVHARAMEDWVLDTPPDAIDVERSRALLGAVRQAFDEDHAG